MDETHRLSAELDEMIGRLSSEAYQRLKLAHEADALMAELNAQAATILTPRESAE